MILHYRTHQLFQSLKDSYQIQQLTEPFDKKKLFQTINYQSTSFISIPLTTVMRHSVSQPKK